MRPEVPELPQQVSDGKVPAGFGPPPAKALRFEISGAPLFWMEPQGCMPFDRTPIFTIHMAAPGTRSVLAGQAHCDTAVTLVKALRVYHQGTE